MNISTFIIFIKEKTVKLTYTFIILYMFPVISFAIGPWPMEKNKSYAQFSGSFQTYNKIFIEGGALTEVKFKTHDNTYQLYAEYGLSEKFTMKIILPFKDQYNAVDVSNNY